MDKINKLLHIFRPKQRTSGPKTYIPSILPDLFKRPEESIFDLYQTQQEENDGFGAIFLYRFRRCPFSSKIKAMLDHFKLEHIIMEVEPSEKLLLSWSDYKMVPVLRIHSPFQKRVAYESLTIQQFLLDSLHRHNLLSTSKYEKWHEAKCKQTMEWINKVACSRILFLIFSTPESSQRAFDYLNSILSEESKLNARQIFSKKYREYLHHKKIHHLYARIMESENIYNAKESFCSMIEEWAQKIKDPKQRIIFHGGNSADICDLSFYGALQAGADMAEMKSIIESSEIAKWYEKTKKVVGNSHSRAVRFLTTDG